MIPQDPVPLYFFSLVPNPIFGNFQGLLDGSGEATLTVNIPNGVDGVRVFFAAVSYDQTGVRLISLPFGVTLEK